MRAHNFFLIAILLWCSGIAAIGQMAPTHKVDYKAKVQAVSAKALESAAAGDVPYAIELLKGTINDLPKDKSNHTYRAFLHFNLGYIYSNYGDNTDLGLSNAVVQYKTALKYQPNDPKILNNLILVLQRQGNDNLAIDYALQGIKKNPAHEGVYYTILGDIYTAQGSYAKAWEAYRKAVSVSDPDPDAGRKLIDMYDELPATAMEQLYEQCKEFDTRDQHVLARLGYEKLTARNFGGVYPLSQNTGIFDESILRWTAISAELGLVTPRVFADGGLEYCTYAPVQELRMYLNAWQNAQSLHVPDTLQWWQQNERRAFHLLAFAKAFADYIMRNGNPVSAITLYENVLQRLWYSPDYSKEIYGRPDVLLTDVVIALARAYSNPKLEMEDQWKSLESRLFNLKGQAYATNDLENRQKFHTILGQIYFDRGELTGYGARNAEFQLRNAITVAESRVKENPQTYFPIPNLNEKLARVYLSVGREDDAYDAMLQAAVGYLETDHLRKCEEALQDAAQLQATHSEDRVSRYQLIKSIHQVRTEIPNLSKEQFDSSRAEFYQKTDVFKWLNEKSRSDILSKDVLERQRFKALSDLSARANAVGASEAATRLSADARTEMKNIEVMSSQQDVVRMRRLDVSSALVQDPSANAVKGAAATPAANEKAYLIATPPGNTEQKVIVDKATLKKQRAEYQKQ